MHAPVPKSKPTSGLLRHFLLKSNTQFHSFTCLKSQTSASLTHLHSMLTWKGNSILNFQGRGFESHAFLLVNLNSLFKMVLTLHHLRDEAEIFLISSLCLLNFLNLFSFCRQEDFFSNLLLSRSCACILKQIIHHYLSYLLWLLFLWEQFIFHINFNILK